MAGITYSGLATLNISLGGGGNDFYLQGNNPATVTNLNLGNGANHLAVGSAAALAAVEAADGSGDVTNTGSTVDNLLGSASLTATVTDTINITGSGQDSMNIDDSGDTQVRNVELNPAFLEFYVSLPSSSSISVELRLNFTGVNSMTVSLGQPSTQPGPGPNDTAGQGGNTFLVIDTFALAAAANGSPAIVINGDNGNNDFAVYDSHAVMTINGGTGNDNFYVFGNSATLNLNGDLSANNNGYQGNDDFYVFASLVASQNEVTNVNGGVSTSAVYDYRMNSLVDINGGSGDTSLFIFGTVLDDVITVTSTTITGAGLDIQYSNIKHLIIESLSGNDVFWIQSVSSTLTSIQAYGGGGLPNFPAGIPVPNLNGAPTQILTLGTAYVSANGQLTQTSLSLLEFRISRPPA